MSDADIIRHLPHWARVAFAARCGRVCLPLLRAAWPDARTDQEQIDHWYKCLPLLRAAWPDAPPENTAAVLAAVGLAEQAAATGGAASGAKAAALGACCAAGAALTAGAAASLACKPAEFAARAVATGPAGSAAAAAEGYGFAIQAAWEAGAGGVPEGLTADLERLRRVAAAGGWTDDTPVPPTVYELLS